MEFVQMVSRTEFDFDALLAQRDWWVVVLDQDQRIRASNEVGQSLLGLDGKDLDGRRLDDIVKLGHLTSLMSKGVSFRSQPASVSTGKLICHYVPEVQNGELRGGVLAIDRVVRAHDDLSYIELHEIVRTLGPIMDLAYEGTIIVDEEGTIVLVNQAMADIFGVRTQDMIGRHILEAYPNSKLSRLPIVMKTGKAEVGWPHFLNGREIIACRYPLISNGRAIGALGKVLIQDVHDRVRLAKGAPLQEPTPGSSPRVAKGGDFKYDINSIIGHSKVMRSLKETLLRVAERGSNVLLVGESGTGKELFAHAIHAASKRRNGPFIKMNCAAIPEHLLESELFGYAEGAFTGAKKGGQIGKFELAHNGTIFLDEISDMSVTMQAKLLRILQERELTPLGSSQARKVDVRIIAATNVKLEEAVREGKFREDLYYRLNVMALSIPPLRDRTEDLYFIVNHFLDSFNAEFGLEIQGLEPSAWEALKAYHYPGNIRELRNIIESAFNVVTGAVIRREHLPYHIRQLAAPPREPSPCTEAEGFLADVGRRPLQEILEGLEKQILDKALQQVAGNKLQAAGLLGISRPGFYKKLQKYGMV
ncbi:sigma 54-interacting transcriptional regulator [Geoalkalibacter sp.]|uniref:sigma 54-interacting transcriptional regulator n=1 Tax=Geoalkalibacter sp. TaxID=3041440 RepID=UPI00272E5B46|nr:sigma 54-interacting transcriptional regulator [Geoalkalibacter sp.]